MAERSEEKEQSAEQEPRGFSEHTRKSPSEQAHEQGWGLNQDERTRLPEGKQDYEGGTDYDYGAQDFGDTAVDTSSAQPAPEALKIQQESRKKGEA